VAASKRARCNSLIGACDAPFLALHLAYPEMDVVPCKIVDEMWHQHILDTAAYREDCEAIFGRFLDHFPHFGMRGEDDARALEDAYVETIDRYREAFGEPPVAGAERLLDLVSGGQAVMELAELHRKLSQGTYYAVPDKPLKLAV